MEEIHGGVEMSVVMVITPSLVGEVRKVDSQRNQVERAQ